jgi:hypothetical protein
MMVQKRTPIQNNNKKTSNKVSLLIVPQSEHTRKKKNVCTRKDTSRYATLPPAGNIDR